MEWEDPRNQCRIALSLATRKMLVASKHTLHAVHQVPKRLPLFAADYQATDHVSFAGILTDLLRPTTRAACFPTKAASFTHIHLLHFRFGSGRVMDR